MVGPGPELSRSEDMCIQADSRYEAEREDTGKLALKRDCSRVPASTVDRVTAVAKLHLNKISPYCIQDHMLKANPYNNYRPCWHTGIERLN